MRYGTFLVMIPLMVVMTLGSCNNNEESGPSLADYFNYDDSSAVRTAGVHMIPVSTPAGEFKVWTKRFGNNSRIKVLLLHGGPAATHEYLESFESFFPQEGFEFYEYDQLGSYYSDQPADSSLWTIERFVEEVEQVRKAIGAYKENFYLYGNSWGGILAIEYALKYQDKLKGLIIGEMMSSIAAYSQYQEKLHAAMRQSAVDSIMNYEARGQFEDPNYQGLLMSEFYTKHICRLPEWPDAVNRAFKHLNYPIYLLMQGPSEFSVGGRLTGWDRSGDLKNIKVPTLTVGATFDTMDPDHMKWMSTQVQKGRFLLCPEGSHFCMWDDQTHFFPGVIRFIKDVDEGKF
jgi:proline iminopeptidase